MQPQRTQDATTSNGWQRGRTHRARLLGIRPRAPRVLPHDRPLLVQLAAVQLHRQVESLLAFLADRPSSLAQPLANPRDGPALGAADAPGPVPEQGHVPLRRCSVCPRGGDPHVGRLCANPFRQSLEQSLRAHGPSRNRLSEGLHTSREQGATPGSEASSAGAGNAPMEHGREISHAPRLRASRASSTSAAQQTQVHRHGTASAADRPSSRRPCGPG